MINVIYLYQLISKTYAAYYIMILQDKIYVVDKYNTTISVITIDNVIEKLFIQPITDSMFPIITDLDTIKVVKSNLISSETCPISMITNNTYFNADVIYNKINLLINLDFRVFTTPFMNINLKDNNIITSMIESKTESGQYILKYGKYCMYIYKSLFSISKSDDFYLDIYDYNIKRYFIGKFIIQKPKDKITICTYISFLKII